MQGDFYSFGGTGKYTDRPTITYAPITGQQFNKSFLTPIPRRAVLFLMQTGWPVDLIMPLTVDAMNGLRAQVAGGSNQRTGDTEFYRVIALLRELQLSSAIGMQIIKGKDLQETTVMFFQKDDLSPDIAAKMSHEKQPQAFTAVRYRDHWLWIDDHDFTSKHTFALLMILFSLMETGGKEGLPVVTIPAG